MFKVSFPPVQCIFYSSQGTCFIISLLFHVPSLFLSCQYKIYSTILNLANLSLASVIAPVTLCHYPPRLLLLWKLLWRTDYIQQQVWLLAHQFTDTNLARWSGVLSSLILAGNVWGIWHCPPWNSVLLWLKWHYSLVFLLPPGNLCFLNPLPLISFCLGITPWSSIAFFFFFFILSSPVFTLRREGLGTLCWVNIILIYWSLSHLTPAIKKSCSTPYLQSLITDDSTKVSWSTKCLSAWSWAFRYKWNLKEHKERKTGKYASCSLTTEARLEVCTRYRVSMEEKICIKIGRKLGQQCQGMLPKIDEIVSSSCKN